MDLPILSTRTEWYCPNCTAVDVTTESQPHTRFHECRGLKGMTAPMVPVGTRCKVEAVEREDYIGTDVVTVDGEGRPISTVVTTRDDGNDVIAFAGCATLNGDGWGV